MSYLQEDLDIIANSEYAEQLKDKKILITGATGLVGSLLVRSLLKIKSEIFIVIRNIEKARTIYRGDLNRLHVIIGDITKDDWQEKIYTDIDYVFHCAAVTASKTMVSKPVETIQTAIRGTDNLLKLAVSHHVKKFLYISSMEVYGSLPEGELATEDNIGYIDISKVRSDYPESKRMCENLCLAYASEQDLDVRIARLAQTFGPGILPWEGRVFAQFAKSVINGTDIVLHTKGLSEGNYCYSRDMLLGLFTILFIGKSREAYNVVNESTHTTIAAMAQMVAHDIAKDKIKVIFDIPEDNKFGYAADAHLKLSGKKLEELGWKPCVELKEMYVRMIEDMKER
jgi:UDP-glucuronate decarboxylase